MRAAKVRVVGREQEGESFVARALFWELAAPSLIKADATLAPGVAALLPPTQAAGSVRVRIPDAGFRLDGKSAPAFFDAAATPGAQVRLKTVSGPESQSSMSLAPKSVVVGDGREAMRWQL